MAFPSVLYDKLCETTQLAVDHAKKQKNDKYADGVQFLLKAARHILAETDTNLVAHYIRCALQVMEFDLGPAYNARFTKIKHYAVVPVDSHMYQAVITRLVSHEPWYTTQKSDVMLTYVVHFADGKFMDVKVVNAEKDAGGPWTEGVLFDPKGNEITHTDVLDSFDEFTIEIDNTTYTAVIKEINNKIG